MLIVRVAVNFVCLFPPSSFFLSFFLFFLFSFFRREWGGSIVSIYLLIYFISMCALFILHLVHYIFRHKFIHSYWLDVIVRFVRRKLNKVCTNN